MEIVEFDYRETSVPHNFSKRKLLRDNWIIFLESSNVAALITQEAKK